MEIKNNKITDMTKDTKADFNITILDSIGPFVDKAVSTSPSTKDIRRINNKLPLPPFFKSP